MEASMVITTWDQITTHIAFVIPAYDGFPESFILKTENDVHVLRNRSYPRNMKIISSIECE